MIKVIDGVNILKLLKDNGFSTYTIRQQRIISEYRLKKLREGEPPTIDELDFICAVSMRRVEEIIEYIPGEVSKGKYHRS